MAKHTSRTRHTGRRALVAVAGTVLATAFAIGGPSTAIAEPGPDDSGSGDHHHHHDRDRDHDRDRPAPAPAAPIPAAPAPAPAAPAAPPAEPAVAPAPQPALILPERTEQATPDEPAVPAAAIGTGVAVLAVGGFAWLLAAGTRRRGES